MLIAIIIRGVLEGALLVAVYLEAGIWTALFVFGLTRLILITRKFDERRIDNLEKDMKGGAKEK
jgi:hypothetical protein